jgi:hypothetical protein
MARKCRRGLKQSRTPMLDDLRTKLNDHLATSRHSQEDVALLTGIPASSLSRFRGGAGMSAKHVAALAKFLGLEVTWTRRTDSA